MMNKDEAIQTLSKVARISVSYAEDLYDSFFPKPVVPQYVADWYEAHNNGFSQFLCEENRGIFWTAVFDCRKTKFTRKELEDADFGWVFDCPGVEVKEVTDE